MSTQPEKMEWTSERVARFWDYESTRPEFYFTNRYGAEITDALKRLTDKKDILDYGCGAGHLIPHLVKAGFQVTGGDFSPESIKQVNSTYKSLNGFSGAHHVAELIEGNQHFDTIVSVEVIEHLEDDILASTLDAYKKLLRKGGTLIVTTPNNENMDVSTVLCPCCNHTFHRWQHVRSWNAESLGQYFENAGFKAQRVFSTNLSVPHWRKIVMPIKNLSRKLRGKPPKQSQNLIGVFTYND
ncbi:MAG: class I SAM-dependent methyltransferase [Rhodospirillales bacterium]|jgi:2-polyprenyl-3-methyl-5-hydroxy-6-metoxy-1,4-benzoquinol methylase|nr:class I SAM-dependent methyltransferase [Rhodospirillales bacterium]